MYIIPYETCFNQEHRQVLVNATKWIHAQKWMLKLKWSHVKANSPKLIIKYSKYSKLTVKYQTIHKVVKRIDQNINNAFLSKNNFHNAKQVFFSLKKILCHHVQRETRYQMWKSWIFFSQKFRPIWSK